MYHFVSILVSVLFLSGGALAQQMPSALMSDPSGWIDLMAGLDLKGWTRLPVPPGKPVSEVSQWTRDEAAGTLVCAGNGGHEWLRYDRELFDFIFHIEFRFTPLENGKGYNSGAYARNSADAKIWHQAQIGSSSGGYIFGDTLVNGQLQRINLRQPGAESRVKPAGEWNTFEITCLGRKISLWTNDAVTSEYDKLEVFRGYVGLEAEGFRIEFRNLKLKPKGPYFGGTGGVVEPVVIRQVLPHYTHEAIKARVQGSVALQAIIRSNGTVDEPKIIRSLGHGLDQEAVRCVIKEWRFKPGSLNGRPVDVYATIEITFTLRKGSFVTLP